MKKKLRNDVNHKKRRMKDRGNKSGGINISG